METESETETEELKNPSEEAVVLAESGRKRRIKYWNTGRFKLEQRVRLKEFDEICGTVKWISPTGVLVGVEFDESIRETLSEIKQFSLDFFNCNSRILLEEDLCPIPKQIPTTLEQSAILSNILTSLKSFGFVEAKRKSKKGKKGNNNIKQKGKSVDVDNNQNEIVQIV